MEVFPPKWIFHICSQQTTQPATSDIFTLTPIHFLKLIFDKEHPLPPGWKSILFLPPTLSITVEGHAVVTRWSVKWPGVVLDILTFTHHFVAYVIIALPFLNYKTQPTELRSPFHSSFPFIPSISSLRNLWRLCHLCHIYDQVFLIFSQWWEMNIQDIVWGHRWPITLDPSTLVFQIWL